MSNLNNRQALDPRWTSWALPTLRAFENTIIAIYSPNSDINGNDWSPYSGPGGTSRPTLLWQGPAQMQVFRQTLTMDDVAGSVTQVRSVRFTSNLERVDLPVRKGLIVRVLAAPHDPDSEKYEYVVVSGLNSGLAWKRTIETESDMGAVVSPIVDPIISPGAIQP